jgi:hypothetical protein
MTDFQELPGRRYVYGDYINSKWTLLLMMSQKIGLRGPYMPSLLGGRHRLLRRSQANPVPGLDLDEDQLCTLLAHNIQFS